MSSNRWFSQRIAAMLLLFGAGAGAGAQTYRVVDLATLAQGNAAVVHGPNTAGAGVGGGTLAGMGGQRRGLLFGAGAARPIPGLTESDDTTVYGLNDTGALVGASNTGTAVRAFAGTQAGAARELPPLNGDTSSAAYDINNLGQAVGFSSGAGGQRAAMWDANGTPTALPGVPNTAGTRATGINERGDVAGVASTAAGQRPILWPRGQTPTELMLLAGHATGEATAINARGEAVGYSADASGARRATLWSSNGGIVDLGTLPGGNFSQAFGTNGAGDVVGTSNSRAVLWARGSGIQDLNRLIPPSTFVLTKAVGINSAGTIIATGHDVPPGHGVSPPHTHEDEHDLPVRVFLLIRSGSGL